eukprot:7004323-Prorocentrum_lima.AAC.1
MQSFRPDADICNSRVVIGKHVAVQVISNIDYIVALPMRYDDKVDDFITPTDVLGARRSRWLS